MLRLPPFLTSMDARTGRAVAVTLGLFATVALVFFFGKTEWGREAEATFEAWLASFHDSPWGLFAAVAVFTAASFIGAPQFVLIAACVVAFGPWEGFLYAWVATVVSAAVNFLVGRLAGAKALERFGGDTVNRLSGYVGRNAFYASFIIRNVPSAPFIVVNMAFGVSRAPFLGFIAGCALGVLPKTALVAIFGKSFLAMSHKGDWRSGLLIAGIGVAWLGLMLGARMILRRIRPPQPQPQAPAAQEDPKP
jgi:uncharacterized membrane protein YdjX (TVP38/TMEM64 family)